MNIPEFTFINSPIYVGAFLALLILIAILKKPFILLCKVLAKAIKTILKSLKTKSKARKLRKQKLKAKKEKIMLDKLKEKPIIKTVVKTQLIKRKYYKQDWVTGLFTILGAGLIINLFTKHLTFISSKYYILEELVYNAVNHKNLTTIIITIVLAGILILIADLFELIQRKKSHIAKVFTILFFSILTAGVLLVLIQTIQIAKLSMINTIIMGTVFIVSGFLFNMKRIFKIEKKPNKEKEVVIIKEDPLEKIKDVSQY